MHQIECFVDFVQRHFVGNQVVYIDFPIHVPVHDLGYIGSTFGTTERGTAPDSSCNKLERSCTNFLASSGHSDNDALAPTLVTAFECRSHKIHISNTFKTEVGSSASQRNQVGYQITFNLVWIDKMCHAEFPCKGFTGRVNINANDLVSARNSCTLNNIETDSTKTKNHHVITRLHFSSIDDSTNSSRHSATDITYFVEWCIFTNFGYRYFGHNSMVCKR